MSVNDPAITGIHSFTLKDVRNKEHSYSVTEHPAGEGMVVMFSVMELGAPTVMTLAGAALQSQEMAAALLEALRGGEEAPQGIQIDGVEDLGKLLVGVDTGSIGREFGRALATGKGPAFVRQVLARTMRDGKLLSDDLAFDTAFKANYTEMMIAVWRVCGINNFFPVPSISLS